MKIVFLLTLLLIPCSLRAAAPVHEFHTTFMTIEHNRDEKLLEITLKVFTHDLVPTMTDRFNKQIDLGAGEELDLEIAKYIREKFSLKTAKGETLDFKWVGKEVDSQVAYFYLEIPFEGELDDASVSNSLFFERFKQQINYVSVKFDEKKADLVFKVGEKEKLIAGKAVE